MIPDASSSVRPEHMPNSDQVPMKRNNLRDTCSAGKPDSNNDCTDESNRWLCAVLLFDPGLAVPCGLCMQEQSSLCHLSRCTLGGRNAERCDVAKMSKRNEHLDAMPQARADKGIAEITWPKVGLCCHMSPAEPTPDTTHERHNGGPHLSDC